jgi:hypothetical protein
MKKLFDPSRELHIPPGPVHRIAQITPSNFCTFHQVLFFLKSYILGRQARLIKNLSVPYGTLEGKECVQKTCRLTKVTELLHHGGVEERN